MKKINKYVTLILTLFLTSCGTWEKTRYYKNYYNNELSGRKVYNRVFIINKEHDAVKKDFCVYSLSYFLPINFCDVRFTDKQYIEKIIKNLNKEGIKGLGMKEIYIHDIGIGTPIFSYYCGTISGIMVE
jgi:hypothetical protein